MHCNNLIIRFLVCHPREHTHSCPRYQELSTLDVSPPDNRAWPIQRQHALMGPIVGQLKPLEQSAIIDNRSPVHADVSGWGYTPNSPRHELYRHNHSVLFKILCGTCLRWDQAGPVSITSLDQARSLAFNFKLCTCILVWSDIGFFPLNEDNNNNNNPFKLRCGICIAANIWKRKVGMIYAAHGTQCMARAESVVSVNYLLN